MEKSDMIKGSRGSSRPCWSCDQQVRIGMRSALVLLIPIFLIVSISFTPAENDISQKGAPLSPTDFVIDLEGQQLIIAQKTGMRIDMVDLHSGELIISIPTELPPTGVILGKGNKAFATISYSEGELLEIDLKQRQVIRKISVGHGAIAPVYSASRNTVYVANQYSDDISVVDLAEGADVDRIKVLRQPMTMDITPDGRWLYVANLLPVTRADIDTVAADVSVVDLETNKVAKHLKLSNGSNALRGLKISPDGRHAFVSHNLGRFQVPTSQLEQGWMNTSALSILDVASQKVLATVLLDEPERGAAASWGIDVNDATIVVNHAGTHDYSLIDYPAMMEKLAKVEDPEALSYDLTFLNGVRKRIPWEGEGPRSIRLAESTVFAAMYFSDQIESRQLADEDNVMTYALNPNLVIDSVRMGEMVFNDARHCFQQWQACTGCHPNEARTDALNWDLLNDGIGNPKNCKSMLVAHDTPPAMITGVRPSAEVAVRAGFRHIQFAQIDEARARAVDHYLRSLKPVPSPYLVDGKLSEKAELGKQVFQEVECGYCHSGEYYTDGKKHKIGVPGPADRTDSWDTPTLVEVWRTAPYLHDGRSATMRDLLEVDQHGLREELEEDKLDALIEYVLSL